MATEGIIPDADAWLRSNFPDVPRETWDSLNAFEGLLRRENEAQNLVSRGTLDQLRLRHFADSAQLLHLAPSAPASWLDLGSGAGFPGLIVAALSNHLVTLVESRRLRIEFLSRAAGLLEIRDRVRIAGMPLERVATEKLDVISARAFAPLPKLLTLAHRFSTEKTIWILPKGRGAQSELEQVRDAWQGDFRLEPSLTDPEARIIVAQGVQPRPKRRETA